MSMGLFGILVKVRETVSSTMLSLYAKFYDAGLRADIRN